jgi:hypothetical protein
MEAVRRDYELSNGDKGTKFERVYDELSGVITGVAFFDGEFGKTLHVSVTDVEGTIVLSMNTATNYAEDMMKKLPALDLTKKVVLKPYSFEDKNKKLRRGISVVQEGYPSEGNKVKNFFADAENKPLYGFPGLTKDVKEYDKEDWKIYFLTTRKFLQGYIAEHICPKLVGSIEQAMSVEDVALENGGKVVDELPSDEINVEGVPFK